MPGKSITPHPLSMGSILEKIFCIMNQCCWRLQIHFKYRFYRPLNDWVLNCKFMYFHVCFLTEWAQIFPELSKIQPSIKGDVLASFYNLLPRIFIIMHQNPFIFGPPLWARWFPSSSSFFHFATLPFPLILKVKVMFLSLVTPLPASHVKQRPERKTRDNRNMLAWPKVWGNQGVSRSSQTTKREKGVEWENFWISVYFFYTVFT